jgi:isopenicillin N synthase-like dioxygenase
MESVLKSMQPIDLQRFMTKAPGWEEDCKQLTENFVNYGVCLVKNPNVREEHNEKFIDMMAKYFESRAERFYKGDKLEGEVFPEKAYQFGATPELIEKARCHEKLVNSLTPENKPRSPIIPIKDHKWRFFWNISGSKERKDYTVKEDFVTGTGQVIPKDFPEWEATMNMWGGYMIDTCLLAAEMITQGLGLKEPLVDKIKNAAHLLAPTGSDLKKNKVGDVFAGFHYDLNFITIHGKSNYPGLSLWTTSGEKFKLEIPEGCLFMQAAKQLEWLTGGIIKAGFHEVIYEESTAKKMEENLANGKTHWRVSSTLFSQVCQDIILQPDPSLANEVRT